MNNEDFQQILNDRLDKTKRVLAQKPKEYSTGTDKLHNFKVAADIAGDTPEQLLWNILTKHLTSISDMINAPDSATETMVGENIGYAINFLILLEALFLEGLVPTEARFELSKCAMYGARVADKSVTTCTVCGAEVDDISGDSVCSIKPQLQLQWVGSNTGGWYAEGRTYRIRSNVDELFSTTFTLLWGKFSTPIDTYPNIDKAKAAAEEHLRNRQQPGCADTDDWHFDTNEGQWNHTDGKWYIVKDEANPTTFYIFR